MQIGWLDPSLDSHNAGDGIIADAVMRELSHLAGDAEIVRLPTQRHMTSDETKRANSCHHFFVGGSNLLNSDVAKYRQWKLGIGEVRATRGRTALLGVGWWQYQEGVGLPARFLWRSILRGKAPHSVRDEYTRKKLASIGVDAVNTSCPTLWELPTTVEFDGLRNQVIATVTDYNRDPELDTAMLQSLRRRYDRVVLWPQGAGDQEYVKSLGVPVDFLGPSLREFDEALAERSSDYFGTRLHAGIRALQNGARASIVIVDNRAEEIGREVGLSTIPRREAPKQVESRAEMPDLPLRLPVGPINEWRDRTRHWLMVD